MAVGRVPDEHYRYFLLELLNDCRRAGGPVEAFDNSPAFAVVIDPDFTNLANEAVQRGHVSRILNSSLYVFTEAGQADRWEAE